MVYPKLINKVRSSGLFSVFRSLNRVLCVLCVLSVLVAACSKTTPVSPTVHQAQNQNRQSNLPNFDEMFDKVDVAALEVGKQISVMGTENSDGSLVANQIIIGSGDFGLMRRPTTTDDQTPPSSGQPNRQDFQNMSDSERAAFRERMQAGGGATGNRTGNGNQGQGQTGSRIRAGGQLRISGEVLSKDDQSLTLKLQVGGSKIVFFSPATVMYVPKITPPAETTSQ